MQFRILVTDRVGLLKDISAVFSKHKINILSSNSGTDQNKKDHVLVFTLAVPSACDIERVATQVGKIKSVEQCQKITLS